MPHRNPNPSNPCPDAGLRALDIAHHIQHSDPLKLLADQHNNYFAVTAYGDDHVTVNGRTIRRSLLLLPDRVDDLWGPTDSTTLTPEHLAPLALLSCDVLLLGTGRKQRFPHPALLRPLIEAGRNIEVMDTRAACRTYNILVAEGRVVAAAMIIETESTL
jgi:uncharacterized protein